MQEELTPFLTIQVRELKMSTIQVFVEGLIRKIVTIWINEDATVDELVLAVTEATNHNPGVIKRVTFQGRELVRCHAFQQVDFS